MEMVSESNNNEYLIVFSVEGLLVQFITNLQIFANKELGISKYHLPVPHSTILRLILPSTQEQDLIKRLNLAAKSISPVQVKLTKIVVSKSHLLLRADSNTLYSAMRRILRRKIGVLCSEYFGDTTAPHVTIIKEIAAEISLAILKREK